MLSDPPRRFVPVDKKGKSVPLAKISSQHVSRAQRLKALALILQYRDRLTGSDCQQVALAAFRRILGNASEKTWDVKLKRTIRRDAGEERFDDLALYFDEAVTRRPESRERIALGMTAADRTLLGALTAKDLARPTLAEKALVWIAACEFIQDAIDRREKQKRAMRRAFDLISGSRVHLARTDDALKRLVKEKLFRWVKGGRTFAALEDRRPEMSGPPRAQKLDESDRIKLIGNIVKGCGGRVSQAFANLFSAGELSPSLTIRFIANPASKSYVPAAIRRQVTPDVKRLATIHHGEREHRLRGAYHSRNWSQMAAGDWFTSDDLTPPVYFYTLQQDRSHARTVSTDAGRADRDDSRLRADPGEKLQLNFDSFAHHKRLRRSWASPARMRF